MRIGTLGLAGFIFVTGVAANGWVYGAAPTISMGLIQPSAIQYISAFPTMASAPINGYVPQVVFGLTDEWDNDDFTFPSHPSTDPAHAYSGASTLPLQHEPFYAIATFDTGAQSHLIRYADAYGDSSIQPSTHISRGFDLVGGNRDGTETQQVIGVGGSDAAEDTTISDALGIYATGFSHTSLASPAADEPPALAVAQGALSGQWNTAILVTEPQSQLPNLIGTPLAAQYQTRINVSQTRHMTVSGKTYSSPDVSFLPLNTVPQTGQYYKMALTVQPGPQSVATPPAYFPNIENFDLNRLGNNPSVSTFWANFFLQPTLMNTDDDSELQTVSGQDFLLDTGAQVSVISKETASHLGIFSDPQTTPDFTVAVSGVGGELPFEAPGYFLDQLSLTTEGGILRWVHVPVLVLDVPDPRDNTGFVPGIIGTNLFSDRDIVINGGTSNPFLGISQAQYTPKWTGPSYGNWGDDANWQAGAPVLPDMPANFTDATTPRTVMLEQTYTAGSVKFDNPNRFTLAGPGHLRIETTAGNGVINVVTGAHTIAAPIDLITATDISLAAGTSLTLSGAITGMAHSISIGSGAQLDLVGNGLFLNPSGTSADQIRQYLQGGRLISSVAAADALHRLGLGYGIVGESLLVKLTYLGDANLNGRIDADDYALLDRGFAKHTTGWGNGDFNYDNVIDGADFLVIDRVFVQQGGVLSPDLLALRESAFGADYVSTLFASIPEPTIGPAIFAVAGLFASRRRRRATR